MNPILKAFVVAPTAVLACVCLWLAVLSVVSGPLLFAPILLAFALGLGAVTAAAWAALGEM